MNLPQLIGLCLLIFGLIYGATVYYSFSHFSEDVANSMQFPISVNSILGVKSDLEKSVNLRTGGGGDAQGILPNSYSNDPSSFSPKLSSTPLTTSSSASSESWVSQSCTDYIAKITTKRTTSVIIYVRNEVPTNLLSTVLSVVKNSDDNLMLIVIVDDSSERKVESWDIWSNNKVDAANKEKIKHLVRFVRTDSRLGVSGAKSLGADFALSLKQPPETLVFLDSNALVSENWLLPLLDVLVAEPSSIVYPLIDIFIPPEDPKSPIKSKSKIGIIKADNVVGGFDWSLNFKWEVLDENLSPGRISVLSKTKSLFESDSDVITASPAAPPTAIAINSKFYQLTGGWDLTLEQWGTESVEFSIRTWLCGGKIIRQPCSRVAVSSGELPLFSPYSPSAGVTQGLVDRNTLKIAERYMRPTYKEIVYQSRFLGRIPYHVKSSQSDRFPTQFTSIKHFSEETCQNFEWFVQEVYPGLNQDAISVTAAFEKHLSSDYLASRLGPIVSQYSKDSTEIFNANAKDATILKSLMEDEVEKRLQREHSMHVPDKVPYVHPNTFKVLGLGGSSNKRLAPGAAESSNENEIFENYEPLDINLDRVLPETNEHDVHANDVRATLVCADEPESISPSCSSRSKDECTNSYGYMMLGCPKFCGWCGSDGLICLDMFQKKCPIWAKEGRCTREAEVMHKACRKSCDVCGKGYATLGRPSARISLDNAVNIIKNDSPNNNNVHLLDSKNFMDSRENVLINQPMLPPIPEKHVDAVISIETTEIVDPYKAQSLYKSGLIPDSFENPCDLNSKPDGEMLSYFKVSPVAPDSPKVFCSIYTMEKNHDTNVMATRDTWGKRCDGFVAFSTKSDPEIPAIRIEHEGPESYDNMWQKSRSIWKYIYKHFLNDFDYFLIGGDDMFYLVENLKFYLNSEQVRALRDKGEGVFIGRRFIPPGSEVFNSGGAGYLIDKKALQVLGENLDSPACNAHQVGFWEDVNIANCLKKSAGIVPIDTRDEHMRERFNPFTPGHHLTYKLGDKADWYPKYHPYGLKEGFECCSPNGISWHYVKHDLLRKLHGYLYLCDNKKKTQNWASRVGFIE